jgi:single-stranded DNA-specific DHH superfamily exonuclease
LYVLRFSNTDIYENIEYVREIIAQYINRDTDKSPAYGAPFIKGESLEDAPYTQESMSDFVKSTLSRYIEFAALGTVSDCMPLVGENRTIVTLGLQAMAQSTSSGLRQFLAEKDDIV